MDKFKEDLDRWITREEPETMDPDELLKSMRLAAERRDAMVSQDGDHADWNTEADDFAHDVTRQFQALDEWLNEGGFLPAEWTHGLDKMALLVRELAAFRLNGQSDADCVEILVEYRDRAQQAIKP